MAAVVLSALHLPGGFSLSGMGHPWTAAESTVLARLFLRTCAALHDLWTDIALSTARTGSISPSSSFTPHMGGSLTLALHAEASPFSSVRCCLDSLDHRFKRLQARSGHCGCDGRR